jgi:uracil-DNA glycosylase
MAQKTTAEPFVPNSQDLDVLRESARGCQGCELYKPATQTVFGEGPGHATMMLVGEQPGDVEDKDGVPFVGPAGHMLDRVLEDAGIVRGEVYVTNAVKHFRFEPRGKRRIHQTPRASEIRACRPWLEAEIDALRPRLIVAMGAIAVTSLLGDQAKVMKDRGRVIETVYGPVLVTVHPSSLLRVETQEQQDTAYRLFLQDLRKGVDFLARIAA